MRESHDIAGETGAAQPRPASGRLLSVGQLVQSALMIALMAVSAQVVVPFGPVPFTMQNFTVALCAMVFGPRQAFVTMAGYLLLGAIGLPVFSAMGSGVARLAGPTGGYLISYAIAVLVASLVRRAICPDAMREGHPRRTLAADVAVIVVSLLICYALGTAHFVLIYAAGGEAKDLMVVLGTCVLPFILPDVLKGVAAMAVAAALRHAVPSLGR